MEQDTGTTPKKLEEHQKVLLSKEKNLLIYKKGIELLLKKITLDPPTKEQIENYNVDEEFKLIKQKKSKLSARQRDMVCRLHAFKRVVLGE